MNKAIHRELLILAKIKKSADQVEHLPRIKLTRHYRVKFSLFADFFIFFREWR